MKTYYGYGEPIEVSDEWSEILLAADREITNNDKQQTRRHCSLNAYNLDDGLLPLKTDLLEKLIVYNELEYLLSKLLPEQRKLVCRIYLEGYKVVEIAAALGVKKSAVSRRLKRAIERMKKDE